MFRYLGGVSLEGGASTTATFLQRFILCISRHPQVQTRAQKDIDTLVGQDRMPTVADASELQYVRAIVKEGMRWMPTIILGSPHGLIQDDMYMGYKIPAGASVINNNW